MKKTTSKKQTSLGDRIRQLRRERDWSQDDLGKKIGVHWQTIGRYESDSIIPTATVLKKIAEVFNITTDFLIFGDSEGVPLKIKDKELLKRFEQVDNMKPENRETLLKVIDVFIRENAAKELLAAS
jgi:transcriptional regulator with XRE-family HTH domain